MELRRSGAFLAGERVLLRPVTETDLSPTYLGWLNDGEVTHYMGTGVFPSAASDLRQYWERFQNTRDRILLAIIDKSSSRHIGNVALYDIKWIHRTAEIGLMIGDKDFWGKGYMLEAESLLIRHAFERMNLDKITAGAPVENVASIVTMKKMGFREEGRLRRQWFINGKTTDIVRVGLLREEFLYMGRRT